MEVKVLRLPAETQSIQATAEINSLSAKGWTITAVIPILRKGTTVFVDYVFQRPRPKEE